MAGYTPVYLPVAQGLQVAVVALVRHRVPILADFPESGERRLAIMPTRIPRQSMARIRPPYTTHRITRDSSSTHAGTPPSRRWPTQARPRSPRGCK